MTKQYPAVGEAMTICPMVKTSFRAVTECSTAGLKNSVGEKVSGWTK